MLKKNISVGFWWVKQPFTGNSKSTTFNMEGLSFDILTI